MKWVTKGAPPQALADWLALTCDAWAPTYGGLQNPEKQAIHESLLREQGYVCCYCGCSVEASTSHIEHFRPQESYPELSLEYSNMHASCIREPKGLPLHCGHAKHNAFDEGKVIAPTEAGCERRFLYKADGGIALPDVSDARAAYMIKLLKLDETLLKVRRREALAGFFDNEFLGSATDEEFQVLCQTVRIPVDGKLPSFGHVLARYAEQLLGAAP